MSAIAEQTVLITGGASGIGRLIAKKILDEGARRVILFDRNRLQLNQARSDFAAYGTQVETFEIDISDTKKLIEICKDIGRVDILINNAGIVVGKTFSDHSHEDIDQLLNINTAAMMHLTLELLPQMIDKKSGHIVNIASAAGLISNPKMSVYCASKWGVIGWSESLRLECWQKNTGVRVTTVTPYYIDTGMFKGVASPVLPLLEPEQTAKAIVRAIKKNQIMLRLPFLIYFLPFIKAVLPTRLFDLVVGTWFGIYKGMDQFEGRKSK